MQANTLRLLAEADFPTFVRMLNESGLKVLGRAGSEGVPTEAQVRSLASNMDDDEVDPYLIALRRFAEGLGYVVDYD